MLVHFTFLFVLHTTYILWYPQPVLRSYPLLVSDEAKLVWIQDLFSLNESYLASIVVGFAALSYCERPAQYVFSCIYTQSMYVMLRYLYSTYSATRKSQKIQK